jgi:hypothetical protein
LGLAKPCDSVGHQMWKSVAAAVALLPFRSVVVAVADDAWMMKLKA